MTAVPDDRAGAEQRRTVHLPEIPGPQIEVETVSDTHQWDDAIAYYSSAGPFHTRAWIESFETRYVTPIYLRFRAAGRPIGIISGLTVEPRLKIFESIDRKLFFFSGPALSDMSSRSIRSSMLTLSHYAEALGYTSMISLARDYPYTYDWGESKVHLQHIHEFIVDLEAPWEGVLARMRKSIPEQARKAARSGVTFTMPREASAMPDLLRLIENTRTRSLRKSGTSYSPYYIPYLDSQSLSRLAEARIARFFSASVGSDVMCVLLVVVFSRRAYALLIGTSNAGYRLRAPAFVWFNAIRELQSEGVLSLNLAGGNAFAKTSYGAECRTCTGSVSPYLKGPIRNLLFQTFRWVDKARSSRVAA